MGGWVRKSVVLLKVPQCPATSRCSRLQERWEPTLLLDHPSASEFQWDMEDPTPPSLPLPTSTRESCQDVSSVPVSTSMETLPCVWPCRPVSSTSGGRRPLRTSALPRRSSPTLLLCTLSITAL